MKIFSIHIHDLAIVHYLYCLCHLWKSTNVHFLITNVAYGTYVIGHFISCIMIGCAVRVYIASCVVTGC